MKLFELFHHPPSAFLGKKLVHAFCFDVGVTMNYFSYCPTELIAFLYFHVFVLSILYLQEACAVQIAPALRFRHQSYMKQKLQSHRNQLSFATTDSSTVQRAPVHRFSATTKASQKYAFSWVIFSCLVFSSSCHGVPFLM